MAYLQLIILVPLATFAAVSTAAALCLALAWSTRGDPLTPVRARARAKRLLLWRLSPVVLGLLAAAVAVLAFLQHEPRATVETPGPVVLAAACVTVALTLLAGWRVMHRCRITTRFLESVECTATRVTLRGFPLAAWQVDTDFPLVAVVGIWRPRLLIARRVLERIPPDELDVVLGHELAHAQQRDNIPRLFIAGLPDVIGLADRWLDIERAWEMAAEDAADDLAAGDDVHARTCLASALVRVAKMARSPGVPAVPLLAFHRGDSIERRVRRLLDRPDARSGSSCLPLAVIVAALMSGAVGAWLTADVVLLKAHHAIEWMVNVRR